MAVCVLVGLTASCTGSPEGSDEFVAHDAETDAAADGGTDADEPDLRDAEPDPGDAADAGRDTEPTDARDGSDGDVGIDVAQDPDVELDAQRDADASDTEMDADADVSDMEVDADADVSDAEMDPDADAGTPTRVCVDEEPAEVFCGETCAVVHRGGPPSNRVNLVVIGDGFVQEEMSLYAEVIGGLSDFMFTDEVESQPYVRYARFINFYRIDLVSPESGVDIPGEDIWVDTPLDGEEGCTDYRQGLCNVDWDKTHDAFEAAVAGSDVERIDWRWVTLNHPGYFGETHYPRRGTLAVFAPHHRTTNNIALHEGGHGFHRLGDTFWSGDATYEGREPRWANLTTSPQGERWEQWLGFEDPFLGTVGAYEGGMVRWAHGIFRPTDYDKMGGSINCLHQGDPACPFDAVSREKMVLDIYELVRPLDGWTDNAETLVDPDTLWVDVVACDVVEVDWYVNDVLVAEKFGEVFHLDDFAIGPGEHEVRARAYDETDYVRLGRERMEQEVRWIVRLTQD